jgi:hypothetical protein
MARLVEYADTALMESVLDPCLAPRGQAARSRSALSEWRRFNRPWVIGTA